MAKEIKLLAIETSTSACSLSLQNGEKIYSSHQIAPMQQAQIILSELKKLLANAELGIDQLDAIIYGKGPGSFTGIRIASSVVQGLAFANNIPVIAISSLAAIAQTVYMEHAIDKVLVSVDARMKQIYWAEYQLNSQHLMMLRGNEQLCHPEELLSSTYAGEEWSGAGNGWQQYMESILNRLPVSPKIIMSQQLPKAEALLPLGKSKYEKGECISAVVALPVYLK